MSKRLIDITCEIRSDVPFKKAIAVVNGTMSRSEKGNRAEKWFWLPRSMIKINGNGTVTVPKWLALEKGLI